MSNIVKFVDWFGFLEAIPPVKLVYTHCRRCNRHFLQTSEEYEPGDPCPVCGEPREVIPQA